MNQTANVPFFKPSIGPEEEAAVLRVLRSGWLTTGQEALAFEAEFAQKIQVPYALSVNSNTSGMLLAMEASGVSAGKAVITTPYTFVSTATCARHLGADVYFADVEAGTYSMDPASVEKILRSTEGRNVAAIVPVHIAGNVCDMDAICALARTYGVKVIEDCAHSFPSKTSRGYAGALGDAGVFSFYVTKTITTGEGGMVTTKDPALAKRMEAMRMHGMDRTAWDRYTSPRASWEYDIVAPGYKCNMPDLLAALGRVQLSRAEEFDAKRKEHAAAYNQAFSSLDFVRLPPDGEGNSWHLYLLRLRLDRLTCSRTTFAQKLQERGIGISVHFIPLFHFTYWKQLYPEFRAENFPHAQSQYEETISLPLWPDMTEQMRDHVIDSVKELGEEFHGR